MADRAQNNPTADARPPDALDRTGWRLQLLNVLILCGWAVLIGRLIHLQGAQRVLLEERVTRQRTYSEPVPARPGEILDRSGHVLAMTVTRDSVYAVPAEIDDPWDFAWTVSEALQQNADDIYQRITADPSRQFVWLRRRATEDQLSAMRALALPPSTWGLRREYLRQYPQGAFAAHVIGIRDIDNVGHGGLEQSLDPRIRGVDGARVMTRDALGVVVEVAAEQSRPPEHGRSVVTTLDLPLQIHAELVLDRVMVTWQPAGACAIVVQPRTGQVLAMASRPAYDPNDLNHVPSSAWKNLCVAAVFEPGSTFKPFVVGRAVETGCVSRDEDIDCSNGALRIGSRVLHDYRAWGTLSVEDVLVKSSNIGMARIAMALGITELHDVVVSYGFGRRTGIELPGEVRGLVRPVSAWDEYSLGSVPMGHEIAVTPIQLIAAHAALANGGRWIRPRLLVDRGDADAGPLPLFAVDLVDAPPAVRSTVIDRDDAEWLVQGPLRQVIERGTARTARTPGLELFGKTGTSQKIDPESGRYSDEASVVSFVGGAPARSPEVMALVLVDAPTAGSRHGGGSVAAPPAAEILQFALQRVRALRRAAGHPSARP